MKVEASKFTEIGYVGRDVESMIRDLTELTINMARSNEQEVVRAKAEQVAEERLLDLLLPGKKVEPKADDLEILEQKPSSATREKLRKKLRDGELDERFVDMDVEERAMPVVEIFSNVGMEEMGINFKDMFGSMMPKNTKRRKLTVSEAKEFLIQEEAQRLVDMDKVVKMGIEKVEQSGIIFLDEIDKIVASEGKHGPDISREGVQRDLLPLVEGSTVNTKYGHVKTDHILFIASGAFHTSKPSDLIPELQGRFPIRVELDSLGKKEFVRILTEPKNALILQYMALLRTDGVELVFEDEAIEEIAQIGQEVNERTENIGARRLHTMMERLLEDVLFDSPYSEDKKVVIDAAYVKDKLAGIKEDEDLSRYIL